jgi:hypothetical protein
MTASTLAAVAVALADIVMVVALVRLRIVVPGGIPVPEIDLPMSEAVKMAEGDVRVAELLVVPASDTVLVP